MLSVELYSLEGPRLYRATVPYSAVTEESIQAALIEFARAGGRMGMVGSAWVTPDDNNVESREVPLLLLGRARQRALAALHMPRLIGQFYALGSQTVVGIVTIYVDGSVEQERGYFGMNFRWQGALMDALIMVPEEERPAVLASRYIEFRAHASTQAAEPLRRDDWMMPVEADGFNRFLRFQNIPMLLRELAGGDVDRDEDESTDLDLPPLERLPNRRTFGIELEFLPNGYSQQHYGDVVQQILNDLRSRHTLMVRGYGHSSGREWDLKTDSSCGYELASPALTWSDWPEVEAILKGLVAGGARVNHTCGFHVHHEARDLRATGLRRLLLLWVAYEKVLTAAVLPNRKQNRYCSLLTDHASWKTFKEMLSPIHNMRQVIQDLGRYQALNITGWWQHGRIEIRLHHGTLRPYAIRFWTLLTQQMVEFAKVTRSYAAMEEAFSAKFRDQIERFNASLTYHARQEEVMRLPKGLEAAITKRNAFAFQSEAQDA